MRLTSSAATDRRAARGAERRREKRFEIDLPGQVEYGEVRADVLVSDVSAGGALVTAAAPVPVGTTLVLTLFKFGPIEARVVHAGPGFCGLQFVQAHRYRDRLLEWLRQEADAA